MLLPSCRHVLISSVDSLSAAVPSTLSAPAPFRLVLAARISSALAARVLSRCEAAAHHAPSGASATEGPDIEVHDGYRLTAVSHVVVGTEGSDIEAHDGYRLMTAMAHVVVGAGDELHAAGTQGTVLAHIAAAAGGDECWDAGTAAHIAVGAGTPMATPAMNTLDSEVYSNGVQMAALFLRRPPNQCFAQHCQKIVSVLPVPPNRRTAHKRSLSAGLSPHSPLRRQCLLFCIQLPVPGKWHCQCHFSDTLVAQNLNLCCVSL